ncbi:MAG: RidA family protein [Candidatus Rokuibacteriota bacterium]
MAKKSIRLPGPVTPLRIPNAVKAGPWVFVSGTMGGPVGGGLAPEVREHPELPLAGEAKGIRESRHILETIEAAFTMAGTSVAHGVWLNQFVTGKEHVDPYHEVRRDFIKPPRPASTTVGQPGLLAPDATIQVDMVAIDPGLAPVKEGITTDKIPQPLAGAGYSPAVRVGDHVFVAGQMATDFRTGIPPEAQVSSIFWEGSSIRRQTDFVLKNLALALEAAGSSLDQVVKAQVWLADVNDLPRMEDSWRAAFPTEPPARTVLPATAFGVVGGIIEVNLIALRSGGAIRKQVPPVTCPIPLGHASAVVRAGDLVFLSGLLAADSGGLIARARIDPGFPHAGSAIRAQTEWILEQADELCRAAGLSLDAVARQQLFYRDLAEFDASFQVLARRFGDDMPATSVVRVPGTTVPGCTVVMDMWAVRA